MNRFMPRLVSLALFTLLCASLTYWIVTLRVPGQAVPDAVQASRSAASVDDAALLFGGPRDNTNHEIRLFGVLNLGNRVAAILSVGDDPAHAVGLDQAVGNAGTLAEVRPRSIVIDRHGVRSEVFLQANPQGTNIYLR